MKHILFSLVIFLLSNFTLLARVSTPSHFFRSSFESDKVEQREGEGRGTSSFEAEELGNFSLVELNCENLFDCEHDSLKQDQDFLPDGMYQWTYGKYWKKVNNIAREILACSEQADGSFAIPDMVALCEIENDSVIRDLTQRSLLRNAKYEAIVTNSPDERGIDVAFLYSPFTFGYIDSHAIRVTPLKDMRKTRDILYVKGRTATEDTLHVFVVHAPSRSGGEYETRANRMCVAEKLAESLDSLRMISPDANIIVVGDFNDYNVNPSLQYIEKHELTDVSANAKGRNNQAQGTYKFQGEWGSLDHIFLSNSLLDNAVSCEICDFPFLLCKDEEYGGIQPFRNFKGVKWQDGFSDHLPLILYLTF